MHKTPDEIKTGVEFCTTKVVSGNLKTCDLDCPYRVEGVWCRNALAHDTLKYIERLEAKVPKWFSAEHTPPTATRKSVEGHDISDLVLSYCNGIYTPAYFNHKEQVWYDETDEWLFVTDWMPLPEPPEEVR